MNAFEIQDGRVVRVDYHGLDYYRTYESAPLLPLEPMRRLRRRLARQGTRGRRTAHMVGLWPAVMPAVMPAVEAQTLVAHRLRRSYKRLVNGMPQDVHEECVVYLHEGERVTPEVIRAVTVTMGRPS